MVTWHWLSFWSCNLQQKSGCQVYLTFTSAKYFHWSNSNLNEIYLRYNEQFQKLNNFQITYVPVWHCDSKSIHCGGNCNKNLLQCRNFSIVAWCDHFLWHYQFNGVFMIHVLNKQTVKAWLIKSIVSMFDLMMKYFICRLIVMYTILPETENRSLEDIEMHYSDNKKGITDIYILPHSKAVK